MVNHNVDQAVKAPERRRDARRRVASPNVVDEGRVHTPWLETLSKQSYASVEQRQEALFFLFFVSRSDSHIGSVHKDFTTKL